MKRHPIAICCLFLMTWSCVVRKKASTDKSSEQEETSTSGSTRPAREPQELTTTVATGGDSGKAANSGSQATNTAGGAEPLTDPEGYGIQSMALLGDSIGVGFIADLKHGASIDPRHPAVRIMQSHFLGSGGDIFARLSQLYKDNYPSSFVSSPGDDCFAHSCKLGLDVDKAKNHAMVAHTVSDLLRQQLPLLAKDSDYIVVEIGSNDYCRKETTASGFGKKYKEVVRRLSALDSNPVILFVPLMPIDEVFTVLPSSTPTGTISVPLLGSMRVTCGDIRDGEMFEDSLCERFESSAPSAADRKLLRDMNSELSKAVAAANNTNFVVAESIAHHKITRNDLAFDCFHPATSALEQISLKSWKVVEPLLRGRE